LIFFCCTNVWIDCAYKTADICKRAVYTMRYTVDEVYYAERGIERNVLYKMTVDINN